MALLISLLGPLVIESDERRLGKVPRKARALLAYLSAQAQGGGRSVAKGCPTCYGPIKGRIKRVTVCATACWSCEEL